MFLRFLYIIASHEDAKKLCYEAISIFKKRLPETDIRIAEAYHTLGFVFFVDKDYEMAVEFYSKSLKAKIVLYGEGGHISMVRTYNLMGVAYWYDQKYSLFQIIQVPVHGINE